MANKALVHRPSTTLMTPKGAIDNTLPVNFSFTFDGYICKTVNLVFYTGLDIVPYLTVPYSVTGYNASRITVVLPAGTITSDSTNYYGIDVGGEQRTIASVGGTQIATIENHGLNTGDEINIVGVVDPRYVNVSTRNTFTVYKTREMALLGSIDSAEVLTVGQLVTPWGRSDRVAIQIATKNLHLTFDTTEIPSQKYTLIPNYTKPPTGNLVIRYRCYIYDVAGNIVNDSGEIFSGNIQYTFSGFLANTIYQIRFTAVDEYNYFYDTGNKSVLVNFNVPTIVIKPEATNLCYEGCIQVNWAKITQIIADITGSIDYIDNWIIEDNTALLIQPNSTVSYTLPIPKDSPPMWIWGVNNVTGFDGVIARLENQDTGESAYLSYNDSTESWFITVNGKTTLLRKEKIIPTNIYLIAFYGATAYIRTIVDLAYVHNELDFDLTDRTNIL